MRALTDSGTRIFLRERNPFESFRQYRVTTTYSRPRSTGIRRGASPTRVYVLRRMYKRLNCTRIAVYIKAFWKTAGNYAHRHPNECIIQ